MINVQKDEGHMKEGKSNEDDKLLRCVWDGGEYAASSQLGVQVGPL
jgi:hypothetical protein